MMKPKRHAILRWVLLALALGILMPIARDLAHLGEVADLARHHPHSTSLMRRRAAEAMARGAAPKRTQVIVPYTRISPYLRGAVVAAEDRHFFFHHGVDLADVKEAVEVNLCERRLVAGGSSITQQLAKNLYLDPSRSFSRKASELVIAFELERRLPKERILELYLNNIEWGEGIYGCEAASRVYFRRSAADLSPEQAIRLASIIPNPRVNTPFSRSDRMTEHRKQIAGRMYLQGYLSAAQYRKLPYGGRDLPGPEQGGRWRRLLRPLGYARHCDTPAPQ